MLLCTVFFGGMGGGYHIYLNTGGCSFLTKAVLVNCGQLITLTMFAYTQIIRKSRFGHLDFLEFCCEKILHARIEGMLAFGVQLYS